MSVDQGDLFGPPARSLRRRLIWLVSLATLATWLIAASLSYRQARHEVDEVMDAHMAQTAALLLAQAMHMPGEVGEMPHQMSLLAGLGKKVHANLFMEFQIGRSDGTVLARSARAPALPLAGSDGYSRPRVEGAVWRSLLLSSGELRIQVLQSQEGRRIEALEIAVKTLLPLALMIPVLLLLIYLAVRRGLRPLDTLAAEVALRSPEHLDAVPLAGVPAEVVPLVTALNRLLARVGQSLEHERRFTADAAHELRTPLAAIRVQAQVALASTDSEAHRHALGQVVAGTERATRLVEQLLRLARLDPVARLDAPGEVALDEILGSVLADLLAAYPERAEDINVEAQALRVQGDAALLGVALRNLLENALRYTAPGIAITAFASHDNGDPVFGVRDDGPGVPEADLPRLIERFYRGKQQAAGEGSGLGLAIVRRIAQLHGAQLEIENLAPAGFMAQLRWDR